MTRYSIEPGTRKYVKGYGFLSFVRKYKKQLLDAGLDSLKTAFKNSIEKVNLLEIKLLSQYLIHTMTRLWTQNLFKKQLFHQKKEKKY